MSLREAFVAMMLAVALCAPPSRAHDGSVATPPSGHWRATLVSSHEPAPGVRIVPLPGRVPGMLLENSTTEPVLVLGRSGEPFLRFSAAGVEVNSRSPLWIENERARGEAIEDDGDPASAPAWRRVSVAPRLAWIEFRAWPGADEPRLVAPRDRRVRSRFAWSIPLRVGGREIVLVGLTTWQGNE